MGRVGRSSSRRKEEGARLALGRAAQVAEAEWRRQNPRSKVVPLASAEIAGPKPTDSLRERERVKFRPPRKRAPRGLEKVDEAGWLAVPFEAREEVQIVELTPADAWVVGKLRDLIDRCSLDHNGQRKRLAEERHVRALHAAHEAAGGWPPMYEWQRLLRSYVWWALMYHQSHAAKKRVAPADALSGEEILKSILFGAPNGTVPEDLTANDIDRILATSTIRKRAGGTGRRRVNFQKAIDKLIDSLSQYPYRPRNDNE